MLDFDIIHLHPSKKPGQYGLKASTLLVSCFDFRLRDEVEALMETIGLIDQYDEIVLPGASIAVAGEKYPHWATATEEVIQAAQELHGIKNVILLDHKDCGAFRLAYGEDNMADAANETEAHQEQMRKALHKIQRQFPTLKVYVYIMGLDGVVENWTGKLQGCLI